METKIIEKIKELFEKGETVEGCNYKNVDTLNEDFTTIEDLLKLSTNFGDIFNSVKQSNLRSWDNCRRVFRRAVYQRNPNSKDLPTIPECECKICGDACQGMNCRLCDNSLALNLAFYLSSWGMYRSSFLKKYDHTIHIGAVKILMDSQYAPLFDPWIWKKAPCRFKCLVNSVYEKLWNYYTPYAKAKVKSNGNTYTVTDTLITKILLGVYGCMPAYDKYVREVIRLIGGTNKIVLTPSNIPKVLDEIILLAHIFLPIINLILNQNRGTWDRCELYTPMKVLDMILFSLG